MKMKCLINILIIKIFKTKKEQKYFIDKITLLQLLKRKK